jgi:hypothetical protein
VRCERTRNRTKEDELYGLATNQDSTEMRRARLMGEKYVFDDDVYAHATSASLPTNTAMWSSRRH